jgi:hypothetical protein
MRIKVIVNLGRDWPEQWLDGDVVEAPGSLATKLIAAGLAEPVEPEPTPVSSPPPAPPAPAKGSTAAGTVPVTPGNFSKNPHPSRK